METAGNISTKLLIGVGVGVGVVVLTGAAHCFYKYLKRDVVPEKWRRVGTLAQINIFPVKSCAPLKLSSATAVLAEILGLRLFSVRDRAFMVIDDNDSFVTARVYPRFVLIQPKVVSDTKLALHAPDMETLELDFETLIEDTSGKSVRTAVWDVELFAIFCGEKYDKWFSRFLLNKESGLHLVYYPYGEPVRVTNPRLKREPFIMQQDSGTFNDATSYMLMNLASVDELNTRLKRPVDPLQFRGNFHLKMDSDEPYAEDHWNWIRIGDDAIFRKVAPCTRCIFPNINVLTAERDPEGEPFKTLKSYRQFPNYASPAIGIHLGVRQLGAVKANDVIYVEDY